MVKQAAMNFIKKVSLAELFYDLVFVLAISRFVNIFEHDDHSKIIFQDFLKFGLVLISLINVWVTKTIFINRYGRDTFVEKLFMLIDMAIIMYISYSINNNWEESFKKFNLAFSFIVFSFVAQFLYFLLRNKEVCEYRYAFYIYISFFFSIGVALAVISQLSYRIGIYFAIVILILTWLVPHFIRFAVKEKPINLPHAIERLNLLTIIFFGEMLIVLSHYFEHLDWKGILAILFSGSIFLYYTLFFDNMIDHHKGNKRVYWLFFIHYFIFISISLLSLDFEFSIQNQLSLTLIWIICYIALFMYVLSLFLILYLFGKEQYRFNLIHIIFTLCIIGLVFGLGFINISYLFYHFCLTSLLAVLLVVQLYGYISFKKR
ncbi:low temperature requirement protein A [Mycoplasmopsis glycophila]|uniref:Predicted membrane protein n=1 Tax=Mycoplasmopsis glycophila TaxID=171285 RepID=A0A449AW76_9BACT|nr:low temperature requirement protein A [Mycoplasmopsis glycophila]VEU70931.1 Predicted membrane protein [Mycoplasmopsis glycophila]